MDINPIHTERDYQLALAIASRLVDADPLPDTPDGDRLEALATLIGRYEAEHFPLDRPDASEDINGVNQSGKPSPCP
jgi:HTH-type transcriptional regulator / antitoxin HigA